MTVRGAVSVTTVSGNAVTVLGGTNQTLFAAGVTMKTGKGSNTVSIEGKVQTVLGNVAITAGGATNFTMSPATSFFVAGGLTFKGSKLADAFTLTGSGTITGKLSADLGAGAAQTATLTGAVGSGFAVLGDVTVKQGESTGTSLTKISGVGVGGKLAVTTAGANDTVRIDSANVFGTTMIGTGAGSDILEVETLAAAGPSVFGGLVKIALGDGADAATFGNGSVDDRVNLTIPGVIDAGTGTDTVLYGGRGNVGTLNILNVP